MDDIFITVSNTAGTVVAAFISQDEFREWFEHVWSGENMIVMSTENVEFG